MNVLDIIVVVISFCGFISRKFPNISVVRLLRWFHHPDVKISPLDAPLPLVSDIKYQPIWVYIHRRL